MLHSCPLSGSWAPQMVTARWPSLGSSTCWSASQPALTPMYQIPFPESSKANADLSKAENTQSVELAPKYQCSMPTWSFIDCGHLLLTRAALGGPHVSICRNCSLQVNLFSKDLGISRWVIIMATAGTSLAIWVLLTFQLLPGQEGGF